MNESPIEDAATADKQPTKKQRALNALVFLLAAAVVFQAYVLFETNERLSRALEEIDAVRNSAKNGGWTEIPRPSEPDLAQIQPHDPQQQVQPFQHWDPQNWDPFAEMERMRQEMDRIMDRSGGSPNSTFRPRGSNISRMIGAPRRTHIENRGGVYVLWANLPGVKETDIDVTVENQLLTMCVKQEQNIPGGDPSSKQQRASECIRERWTLPEPVDGSKMQKTFESGVLTVVIPKASASSKGVRVR
ncbi:MAG: Hsp20/alpha crystallin family protein [Candidatus Hydrogenedentes bacterium]|nr:Hsp20/alpha crystallin family protein [Candidatus Hydrogenedentota bacterium]